MRAFVLAFVAATLATDAVLGAVFVSGWGLALMLPAAAAAVGAWQAVPKAELKEVSGLDLGPGEDMDNPDQPRKVGSVVLEDKALNLGFLAIGGPGSGKTVAGIAFLEYFTRERAGGWCYWDGKGDKDIYQKCMACGAQPDHFFSSELPYSDTVNVVSGPMENVIDRLTQVLIVSESDYYRNAQRAALRSVLPVLHSLEETYTLRDLYVAFNDPEAGQYVLNKAREQGVAPDVIKAAQDFYNLDEEQRQKDINGLLTRMQLFVTGEVNDRLNAYRPTLDLEQAAKENRRVYFHMPYTQMARDIGILLTEQIGVIAKNRQLFDTQRAPWPQVFDDWGAFFYPNIGPITARCRSAGMPVSYLFQSRGQTDRVEAGGHFTTEVTDNIGGMFVMRINGQESAKWAAEQFGEYESTEFNVNDSTMWDTQSLGTREKPRVRGDTLKNLDAGEAYISCLISGEAGASWNKRYRARFPLPDFTDADAYDWPVITAAEDDDDPDALHLWRDFMDPDRLKKLKQEIVEAAADDGAGQGVDDLEEHEFL